jgi:hypothetical protein
LGSGSSLLGYYMYHGGQNPDGQRSTLQESTATGYANDLPVKSYDFDAPIGEYGQINPQYYWLRRLHLFLQDFGSALAQMPAIIPTNHVNGATDVHTLRWSVRSDGRSGYLFVNNYQRLQPMPAKTNVQFQLNLPDGKLVVPKLPVTIPADSFFCWPFNLNLAGAKLTYATAQLICRAGETFYFAKIPGVNADFVFEAGTLAGNKTTFTNVETGRQPVLNLKTAAGKQLRIVLLDEADSLAIKKQNDGSISFDKPGKPVVQPVNARLVRDAGPARQIPLSSKTHLAIAPTESDFTNAAVWQIQLPPKLDLKQNPLLRVRYLGDVARFTLNGRLLDDNFYAGREFDLGLRRYAPEIFGGNLQLEILPLRKDAPIYIEPKDRPEFGTNRNVLKLESVEIVR